MAHGVELEGELENDSPDVVVGQAELPEGGGRVIVEGIEEEDVGVGDAEALVEEMGSGRAEAGADEGHREGTAFESRAEKGGGDDFGVHVEVVGQEES